MATSAAGLLVFRSAFSAADCAVRLSVARTGVPGFGAASCSVATTSRVFASTSSIDQPGWPASCRWNASCRPPDPTRSLGDAAGPADSSVSFVAGATLPSTARAKSRVGARVRTLSRVTTPGRLATRRRTGAKSGLRSVMTLTNSSGPALPTRSASARVSTPSLAARKL
jgi:hypothetical protein